LASISLQASDPWVPFIGYHSTSQRGRRLVARFVSIHHILWYALAIRQRSDFGITAAVGRKRPCKPKSVCFRILRGGRNMAASANNPRAALDLHRLGESSLGSGHSVAAIRRVRARPAVFGGHSEADDRLPYIPVAPVAHTRRLAVGHCARHQQRPQGQLAQRRLLPGAFQQLRLLVLPARPARNHGTDSCHCVAI
jgi:hypothetical protein